MFLMNSIRRGISSSLPFGRGDGTKQLCSNPAGLSDSEKERDLWADPGEGRCVCLSSALPLELAPLSASLRPRSPPQCFIRNWQQTPLWKSSLRGLQAGQRRKASCAVFPRVAGNAEEGQVCGGTSSARPPRAVPATLRTDAPPGFQRTEVAVVPARQAGRHTSRQPMGQKPGMPWEAFTGAGVPMESGPWARPGGEHPVSSNWQTMTDVDFLPQLTLNTPRMASSSPQKEPCETLPRLPTPPTHLHFTQ